MGEQNPFGYRLEWEYFVKDIAGDVHDADGQAAILNHYGKQGWELVTVKVISGRGVFAYFKRVKMTQMEAR